MVVEEYHCGLWYQTYFLQDQGFYDSKLLPTTAFVLNILIIYPAQKVSNSQYIHQTIPLDLNSLTTPPEFEMGQGGGITLINGTPHDWKRAAPPHHRMENWNIPDIFPAGQSTTLYIECPSDVLTAHIPEFAHETFTLSDTPFHFALGALTF